MKKTILAVAIASVSASSFAVELYNNDGTTFSIGGHVSVNVNDSEKGDADVGTNSPRINFNATQELGNGFTADAKGEWALNYLNGGENAFTTRLGYVGLSHDSYGRAVVGTQWAPYYDVAGVADMPIAFANDFIYDNHSELGTGRADKMVSYRNGFDFDQAGELSFALGWQGTNDEQIGAGNAKTGIKYDDRVQAALSYAIADFKLGYTYNTGDFVDGISAKEKAKSHLVSAKYGTYGKGIYVAGVYASNEYMNNYERNSTSPKLLEESTAYEGLVSYAFENSLNLIMNYEKIEGKVNKDSKKGTALEHLALQAEYNFTPKFIAYTAYQFDLNDSNNAVTPAAKDEADNKWLIGARYYL
ncbi:porin [Vibrio europaeus]|nr:porin [Vibrio europaeus]MDC5806189.1 porin [Vibrio europaeus]MDC5812507.1 porin [Vibrio europaeus]MDC5825618.1 porin [Vibrio europaeus]MDC5831102.1 porin [Vibrio europaeus]MDC5834058.1 porin [Vibrio europaeus]